jgi:hypothetical protein
MDAETLNEIARELGSRDLEVRLLGHSGIGSLAPILSVLDPAEDIVIRDMVTPSANNNPQFWAEAFCGSNAQYVVPIVTKLDDVANEVLVRRACKARQSLAKSAA